MATPDEETDDEFYICDYMSSNAQCDENTTVALPVFTKFTAVKVSLLALMIVMSTVGNCIAIAVTCKIRGRRKSTVTTLILNLAVVDLIVTYGHMLVHMIWYITDAWRGGVALCKIAKFFSSFGLFASSFITVDVGLDRCLAVLRPLGQRQRPFHIKIMIIVAYILAFIFSIPQIVIFRLEHWPFDPNVDYWQCVVASDFPSIYNKIYTTLVIQIQVTFPLAIMVAAYGLIFNKVRQKIVMKETSENLTEMRQARSKLFLRAQRRTVRMAVLIFTVFTINWFPYAVFSTLYVLTSPNPPLHDYFFELAFLFGLSNSCFNPVIYGACNVRYCHKVCSCLGLRGPAGSKAAESHSNKTTMYSVRWQSSKAGNNSNKPGVRNSNISARDNNAVAHEKQQMITTPT